MRRNDRPRRPRFSKGRGASRRPGSIADEPNLSRGRRLHQPGASGCHRCAARARRHGRGGPEPFGREGARRVDPRVRFGRSRPGSRRVRPCPRAGAARPARSGRPAVAGRRQARAAGEAARRDGRCGAFAGGGVQGGRRAGREPELRPSPRLRPPARPGRGPAPRPAALRRVHLQRAAPPAGSAPVRPLDVPAARQHPAGTGGTPAVADRCAGR